MDHDGRRERRKKRRKRSKQCATSNSVNADRSHLGDCLKEPTTGRDDESREQAYSQDLSVLAPAHEKCNGLVGPESVGRLEEL